MKRDLEAYEMMLLGQRVGVKTRLSPDKIKDLVVLIEDQYNKIKQQASPNAPVQKLHLLAMLSVAEKYMSLKAQVDQFRKNVTGEISSMKKYVNQFTNHEESHDKSI